MRLLDAVEQRFAVIGSEPSPSEQDSQSLTAGHANLAEEFQSGQQVEVPSRYRVAGLHARGGLGSVYIADDLVLNRRVAIKIPRRGRYSFEATQRFEREARITSRLDHPGIVPVYSMASQNAGRPFYVMRFVEGRTLAETVSELHGPETPSSVSSDSKSLFESDRFRHVLQQFVTVCNITAFAHQKKVIHRDIKPANILLGQFGEVLLLDWGLARRIDETDDCDVRAEASGEAQSTFGPMGDNSRQCGDARNSNRSPSGFPEDADSSPTRTGQMLGTPAFASPEQLLGRTGEIDHRSDIYSLGATLLALLTGKLSFEATGFNGFLHRIANGAPISAHEFDPMVPAGLEAVCRKAMALRPSERYAGVRDLTADLERWLAGEAVSVFHDPLHVRAARFARKKPRLAASLTASLCVALVFGLVGASLLGRKNQELLTTNSKLSVAISESQSANTAALAALRSMFDDVIARKFSERAELSESDLRFLESILPQYEAFALLKGDSLQSQEIQAEGVLRTGQILHTLSQQEEARRHFEKAVQLYEKLVTRSQSANIRDGLIDALSHITMMHHEYGDLDALSKTARQGIALVAAARRDRPETITERTELLDIRLHQELGYLQETRKQHREAIETNLHSVEVLQRLLARSPELEYRTSLARNYRSLGEMSRQLGQKKDMQTYSELAVRTAREVLALDPESRRNHIEFGWTLYDASFVQEEVSGAAAAEPLLTEAIEFIKGLRERYPLVGDYRGLEATLLSRRAALREQLPDRSAEAITDLQVCITLFEPQLSSPGTFQNARPVLRAFNRLLRIHRNSGNTVDVVATADRAAQFSLAYLARYPQLASDSELRDLFEQFASETEQTDPTSATRLRAAIRH